MIGRRFKFIKSGYSATGHTYEIVEENVGGMYAWVVKNINNGGKNTLDYNEDAGGVLNLADKKYWEEVEYEFWCV